jgi:hypothetical protein
MGLVNLQLTAQQLTSAQRRHLNVGQAGRLRSGLIKLKIKLKK